MPAALRHLAVRDVIALNEQIMQAHLQPSPPGEEGLLVGATMRPVMVAPYEDADVVMEAALLMAGIALSQAFAAGKLRTALAAGMIFLDLNGYSIHSAPAEFGQQIAALAQREVVLAAFVSWLRERVRPVANG